MKLDLDRMNAALDRIAAEVRREARPIPMPVLGDAAAVALRRVAVARPAVDPVAAQFSAEIAGFAARFARGGR